MLRIGGRVMTYKVCAAFTMSLGVVLTLASNQAFGQLRAAHGGVSAAKHSPFHPSVIRSHHRNNIRNRGTFFPANGGFFFEPSMGRPNVEVAQPPSAVSGDFTYTYKQDFPWDWAHRYPPGLFASPPEPLPPPVALRPGCPAQTVTVPGADGKDQTITMVRC
jgi:hypothetical protein